MLNTKILLILLVSLIISSCDDNDTNPVQSIDENQTLKEYLESIEFSGSVLFKKNNEDVIRNSYGWADKANSTLNTNETIYRIGSVSKAFTALAVQKLKEKGLLENLDQTIDMFIDDFPNGKLLTIRHLLGHQSGLPDLVPIYEEEIIDKGNFMSKEDILDSFLDAITENDFYFKPGEQNHYSNTNYFLLAFLVEELSGIDFHIFLEKEILVTLEMNNTGLVGTTNMPTNHAKGYLNGVENYNYPMQIAFGAGDLKSNIENLEKWLSYWQNDLSNDIVNEFIQVHQDDYTQYGYGWFSYIMNGTQVNFHGGDIDGFTSLIAYYPEENVQLILLSNQQEKRQELDKVLDLLILNNFK